LYGRRKRRPHCFHLTATGAQAPLAMFIARGISAGRAARPSWWRVAWWGRLGFHPFTRTIHRDRPLPAHMADRRGPWRYRAQFAARVTGVSGSAHVDEVGDDLEVLGAVGQERDAVGVGCRCDHRIDGASARLRPRDATPAAKRPHSRATAASKGSGWKVASTMPRRCARRAGSSSSCARRTPKMQLGQRCGADRAFEVVRSVLPTPRFARRQVLSIEMPPCRKVVAGRVAVQAVDGVRTQHEAADAAHQNLSTFVLGAASRHAEDVLAERTVVELSPQAAGVQRRARPASACERAACRSARSPTAVPLG